MRTLAVFQTLGPVDLKNVRREAGLAWFPILPLVMAVVFRIGVPVVSRFVDQRWAVDLAPYYSLIMSTFLLLAPAMVGMVIGFLLLDERDDQMLNALLVTPMPLHGYLLYRLSVPIVLGMLTTLVGYPVANLVPIGMVDLLAVAALASFTGPLIALFLASFAPNKVAGFALIKLLNTVNMLPIVAFFIPSNWQLMAGILPAYWPLKVFWLAAQGQPYTIYWMIGLVINLVALWIFLQRFKTVLHR